jgi:hypothetical protein
MSFVIIVKEAVMPPNVRVERPAATDDHQK